LRDAGADSSGFGRARGFSTAGGGDLDLDFDSEPLLDELAEPELLEALDDREEDPLLDEERDLLSDELSLPLPLPLPLLNSHGMNMLTCTEYNMIMFTAVQIYSKLKILDHLHAQSDVRNIH
jgi:hypothetical protein